MNKFLLLAVFSFLVSNIYSQENLELRFINHVNILASDEFGGRNAGTKEDTLSMEYVRDQFRKIKGINMLGDKGVQRVTYLNKQYVDTASLNVGDTTFNLKKFMPMPSVKSGVYKGTVELFDKSLEYGRYKDKYIVFDSRDEEMTDLAKEYISKKKIVQNSEAAGMFILTDVGRYSDYYDLANVFVNEEHMFCVVIDSNIFDRITKNSGFELDITANDNKQGNTFNVVARLSANKTNNPNRESVIVGAHYDHVGYNKKGVLLPGADDNASGTAMIIELANTLAQNRDKLKKDVVFVAFGAEEQGLKGSKYYANMPLNDIRDVKAMINFDMTGRMRGDSIVVRGVVRESVKDFFDSVDNSNPQLYITWEQRGNGPTDYASFYRKQIPSFSFSTGREEKFFHTPLDTRKSLNYQGMVKLHKYMMSLFEKLIYTDYAPIYLLKE